MTVTSVLPEDAADKTYTWSSANEEIATVDENGKVTAVAAGTVKITATAIDGSGVKAECDVTVKTAAPDGYVDLGVVGANGKLVFFQIQKKAIMFSKPRQQLTKGKRVMMIRR